MMNTMMHQIQKILFYGVCIFSMAVCSARVLAVDCPEASAGADLTLSSSCLFPRTVDGVDNGASKNTANLAVSKASTLTIIPGQTIVAGSLTIDGGTIIIFDGAQIYPGGSFWMKDGDKDGYPSNTDTYATVEGASAPSGDYVRKNAIYASDVSDRNDAIPCPDAAYNATFTPPVCNTCYHGAPDPVVKNSSDTRCGVGSVCDGVGSCYSLTKRIFISSASYTGALGGLSGADAKCQTLADAAVLGGTWKAWLSDTSTNAADRMTHANAPYYLVDGITKVANNWSGIVSGSLLVGISMNEKRQDAGSGIKVWTNTLGSGGKVTTAPEDACLNWTATGQYRGRYGLDERYGGSGWTDTNYTRCVNPQNLYCFEQ